MDNKQQDAARYKWLRENVESLFFGFTVTVRDKATHKKIYTRQISGHELDQVCDDGILGNVHSE